MKSSLIITSVAPVMLFGQSVPAFKGVVLVRSGADAVAFVKPNGKGTFKVAGGNVPTEQRAVVNRLMKVNGLAR
jgi:hypothetical protein